MGNKNKKDNLGDRMKGNYENRSKTSLTRRVPIMIRLDGRSFSTFTRGLKKPYDTLLIKTMQDTMEYLCKNIQGCKIGYVQSDEISLLITDYDKITTDAWFDYEVQKMCSISASMATLAFNKCWMDNIAELLTKNLLTTKEEIEYCEKCLEKAQRAMFDSRCFNIPKEEVCNCFIWRQQDATRNAIQLLGQNFFSTKELHKKSCNNIQDMLMLDKGINFNDERTDFKRGACCYKQDGDWIVDKEIPIFTQDREYIERWL